MSYAPVAVVTSLSLLQFFAFAALVAPARKKHGIPAPATSGHPDFERVFRVHYNTMENLVYHLPSLWLFAYYVSVTWATVLGSVWIVGRVIYAVGYYRAAARRELGAIICGLTSLALLGGALIGSVLACFQA